MRIGVDISQIVYEGTGVGRFTSGLADAIRTYGQAEDWKFFCSTFRKRPPFEGTSLTEPHVTIKTAPFPPRVLSWVWNDLHMMPVETFVGDMDWFISSDWTEPPSKIKKATIVHDLTFMRYPETVDSLIRTTQTKRLQWVAKESRLIFADSEATKQDLMKYYQVPESGIIVNYPGVAVQKQTDDNVQRTLKKYHLDKPFIITVGKIEPRKNLKKLIEAYAGVPEMDADLVIIGPQGWEDISETAMGASARIHLLGFIPDNDLYALYQAARFFIFPSLYEGFGYPAVEAMLLGCPTGLADTSSLTEIGRDASFLFDPTQPDSLRTALTTMNSDAALRTKLITQGTERAAFFTWKRYYDTMIAALKNFDK